MVVLAALVIVVSSLAVIAQPHRAFAAGHAGSTTCPLTGAPSPFNRAICDGYFTGVDNWNAGVDVVNVLDNTGGNGALMQTKNVNDFIAAIQAGLYGADPNENAGTAFLIETMLGKNGPTFTTIAGGITQAKADFAYWSGVVRWYDLKGYINWNASNNMTTMSNFVNTGVSTKANNDAIFFMDPGPKDRPLITFTNPDGSKYIIDKNCANPTGLQDPLSSSGWSLEPLQPKVAVGNFVWFDANNDGIVNQNDANDGFNGVNMALYDGSADTNNDGVLSAAEIAAATPAKTTVTANDNRTGSSTYGKAGYYEFTNLDEGDYFVCIAPSSFDSSGKLNRYTASPVPTGVDGNSRSDNKSHGLIPSGGTAQTSGMCASKTTLAVLAEPTTTTTPPDDDTDPSSDTTIDFGFWHPYSIGNRVWLDKDNSGDINEADGPTPGIANVVVDLYDCSGNKLNTTVTDSTGYYRFDDLNAGCYQAEVAQSNFTNNTTLASCNMSSSGPKQSANPDNNIDSDDNGLDVPAGMAVRTGSMHLGPFNSAPTGELDLAVSGQGTDDDFANMTLDLGFICDPKLASTGENTLPLLVVAFVISTVGAFGLRRIFSSL
jgi:hypothetical protein